MGRRNIDEPRARPGVSSKPAISTPKARAEVAKPRRETPRAPDEPGTEADPVLYPAGFIGPPALERYAKQHFTRHGWRTEYPRDKFARAGEWGKTGIQGIGPHGRILCLCGCGVEVAASKRRTTTAKATCWQTWAKVHNPATVRHAVFRRDKGVCAKCKADTERMRAELEARVMTKLGIRVCYSWAQRSAGIESPEGFPDIDRHWWENDHVIPVVEGGGLCDLSGYRTLCIPCHREATAALAKRRADRRRSADGQSSLPMSEMRNVETPA